jgi:hypothetical protein
MNKLDEYIKTLTPEEQKKYKDLIDEAKAHEKFLSDLKIAENTERLVKSLDNIKTKWEYVKYLLDGQKRND